MAKEESAEATQGMSARELGFRAQPPVSRSQDLLSSVVSGAQNVPIGIVGLPGTIGGMLDAARTKAVEKGEELGVRGYSYLMGQSDRPEGEARLADMRKRQQAARDIYSQVPSLAPTIQDISETVERGAQAVGVPGPLYKPRHKEGEFAKTIVEFAAPGLLGKQKALATGVGAISGATSEAAGQASRGLGATPEYEAAARVLGGLAAGVYAPRVIQTGRNILAPTQEAERRLATEIASARREGRAPSDAEIQTAMNEIRSGAQTAGTPGAQLLAFDLLGKQGVSTVERGLASTEGRRAASLIDDFIQARQAEASRRIDAGFDSIFGGKVSADAARASAQRGIDVDNPEMFKIARASPQAQNVKSGVTEAVRNDPLAAEAINAAARTLRGQAPDNLTFWHEVKTNLDYMVNRAFKNNDGLLGRQLADIRNSLRADLKGTVKAYGDALDSASSFFKGKDAIDSGIKFAGSRYDMPALQDARRAFLKYGPDQKKSFEEGYLYQLRENARNNMGSSVVPNLRDEYEKMSALFGRPKADRLFAVATAEDVIGLKKVIDFQRGAATAPGMMSNLIDRNIGAGAGWGGISALLINPSMVGMGAAAGAAAGTARRVALNAEERSVVGAINKILASSNPQQIERLSRMAMKNPSVNSVLEKYKDLMLSMVQVAPSANRAVEAQDRPQRKVGGRVMSAQHMVAAADRAKKAISGKTEALLKSSDETVAKALEIAKQNLEG
jgi:hypothetical protein